MGYLRKKLKVVWVPYMSSPQVPIYHRTNRRGISFPEEVIRHESGATKHSISTSLTAQGFVGRLRIRYKPSLTLLVSTDRTSHLPPTWPDHKKLTLSYKHKHFWTTCLRDVPDWAQPDRGILKFKDVINKYCYLIVVIQADFIHQILKYNSGKKEFPGKASNVNITLSPSIVSTTADCT